MLARHILPIMLAARKPGQLWVEPFVGGGNVIDKVPGRRIGADINPYAIDALKAIRDCVYDLPKNNREFTRSDYQALVRGGDHKYKGYAGFAFSFGGKWLGGWSSNREGRDYVRVAYRNAVRQSPGLQGVELITTSYLDLDIPRDSLIYCDPPYADTTKYEDEIDYTVFWDWCREKTRQGHTVFVSEHNAPDDFECSWSKRVSSRIAISTRGKSSVEKLFRYWP